MATVKGRVDQTRPATVLPLVVLGLTALIGFVALATDMGLMAIARNQCQNAADSAAMAGARTLNGNAAINNNRTLAATNATTAACANVVLTQPITSDRVTINIGKYFYDRVNTPNQFKAFPGDTSTDPGSAEPWTLATATVNYNDGRFFFSAKNWQFFGFTSTATATAIHRPRDVVMIVDFSGSMRFDSLIGGPYDDARTRSQNRESVFPKFGHYSDVATAALQSVDPLPALGGRIYGQANVTLATNSGPALIRDFYQDTTITSATTRAFNPAPDTYETAPAGDVPLRRTLNSGAEPYAQTVEHVLGGIALNSNWESGGYTSTALGGSMPTTFTGATHGPSYWGKTFFIWPPDPRAPVGNPGDMNYVAGDWRRRFFFEANGTTPLTDNTRLWDGAGIWQMPRQNNTNNFYRINYPAILRWLKTCGPNPFPSRMQAGGILYYDSIPDTIDIGTFPPADLNQRFWKQYIDAALGVIQTSGSGATPVYQTYPGHWGYGGDYQWGTRQLNAKPNPLTDGRYMDYRDNPLRPRMRMWFGPMTMVDYLGNYNQPQTGGLIPGKYWWPGTCHESPLYQCKLGLQAALTDIQLNHPNDNASLIYFSSPKYAHNDLNGQHNRAKVPLGRDYTKMINSLWFAPQTIATPNTPIRPYDAAMNDVPRAKGGTNYAMPLMTAFNQLSGNVGLRTYSTTGPTGEAGGFGRRGSQRLVIFETDGVVNSPAGANFVPVGTAGACTSYYKVRLQDDTSNSANEYPTGGDARAQAIAVSTQLAAADDAANPGYSTNRKPLLIHCIGFGTLFEGAEGAADLTAALQVLQEMQFIGGKAGGEQPTVSTPLADYKMIIGTPEQRIAKLERAFARIMQDGVQVSLIR